MRSIFGLRFFSFLLVLFFSGVILTAQPVRSGDSTLMVSGQHTERVRPDRAALTFDVEERIRNTDDADADEALRELRRELDRRTNRLTDALKNLEFVSDTDLKTIDVRIGPWHERTNSSRERVGWKGEHTLRIRTDRLDRVSDLLAVAVENGATSTDQLSFSLKDSTEQDAQKRALSKAVRSAREKAEVVANAADVSLGTIRKLQENNEGSHSPVVRAEAFSAQNDQGSIETPESLDVTASVTMSFEITEKDK